MIETKTVRENPFLRVQRII